MNELQPEAPSPRFPARVENWIHRLRSKRAVRRGMSPSVIPYTGYGTTEHVRILGRVMYLKPAHPQRTGAHPDLTSVSRVRGWRTFTSVHVPAQWVEVIIDDEKITDLTSDRGGVIDAKIPVRLEPGWHIVTLRTGETESADSSIYVVDPKARFGVLSDVDDTIVNTALPKPLLAAWNSFVVDEHARTATPGMAVLLDRLINDHPGAPVIYLSTGPWNAAPTLSRFLERNLYPRGPLLLTDWGPTHDRWFRNGREHKRGELQRLAADFPDVRWVLIGDDGQHDEQLYHEFSTQHPRQVAAVAIRQLSVGQAVLAGGRSKARLHRSVSGVPWVYGPDGATLHGELRRLGVL